MTRPDSGDPTSTPTPFMRLIQDRRAEPPGWSYRDLELRSGTTPDGGPAVSRASLARYATQPLLRPPDDRTIAGLARALDVAPGTVREAIGRSLNLTRGGETPKVDHVEDLVDRIYELPAEAREHVVWVMERVLAGVGAVMRAEPRRDVGEDVADIYDRIAGMDAAQRRRALDALNALGEPDPDPDGAANGSAQT